MQRLIGELQDDDFYVRSYAAWALGEIETPKAIKAAKGAIPDLEELSEDHDPVVRGKVAVALGQIGDGAKDAVPTLIELLQD